MVAKKSSNFEKEGKGIQNWWPPLELREKLHKTCEKCGVGIGFVLDKLASDFVAGKIYHLPDWEPIDRNKTVHYKDDHGKWIYITPEEFFERLEKKKIGPVTHDPPPGEEMNDISDTENGHELFLVHDPKKMGFGCPDP